VKIKLKSTLATSRGLAMITERKAAPAAESVRSLIPKF